MKADDLRNLIIVPTLAELAEFDAKLNTPTAINLMLETAAQESNLGYFLDQLGGGPGLGIYSIEQGDKSTHRDIWRNYLSKPSKQILAEIILSMVPDRAILTHPDGFIYVEDSQLVANLPYSTSIARVVYWREPERMPETLAGRARYWNVHYNANPYHGTTQEYIDSYYQFVEKQ